MFNYFPYLLQILTPLQHRKCQRGGHGWVSALEFIRLFPRSFHFLHWILSTRNSKQHDIESYKTQYLSSKPHGMSPTWPIADACCWHRVDCLGLLGVSDGYLFQSRALIADNHTGLVTLVLKLKSIFTLCGSVLAFSKQVTSYVSSFRWPWITLTNFQPGVLLFMSNWYKKSELARRFAIFYCASLVSGAVGGLIGMWCQRPCHHQEVWETNKQIAGVITDTMQNRGNLPAWKWLFLSSFPIKRSSVLCLCCWLAAVEGCLTVGFAAIAM